MKNLKRNVDGITLIALVVTIVVLLILAGVSIRMLLGEDGLIKMATKSVDEYNKSSDEEQKQLDDENKYINDLLNTNPSEENYDDVTGGEIKLMDTPLTINTCDGYYDTFFTNGIAQSLSYTNQQEIRIIEDKETGKISDKFTSFNSVLTQTKNESGARTDLIVGWDPDKYWSDIPNNMMANAPYALEFMTDADEIIFYACGYIRISVDYLDGKGYLMSTLEGFKVEANGTYNGYVCVNFGENGNKQKNVKIETEGSLNSFIIGSDKTIEKVVNRNPKKILFIGDSWTEGVAIDDGKRYLSFSNIIADRLNMACINNGIGGSGYNELTISKQGTGQGIEYAYEKRLNKQLTTFHPDVIVINGGGNDVTSEKNIDVETTKAQADSLYSKLKEYKDSNAGCKVVIMGVEYLGDPVLEEKTRALNNALIETAQKYNLPYIDYVTGDTYGENGEKITIGSGPYITEDLKSKYIYSDNFHPTEEGHKYLGNVLAVEMEKALRSIK